MRIVNIQKKKNIHIVTLYDPYWHTEGEDKETSFIVIIIIDGTDDPGSAPLEE